MTQLLQNAAYGTALILAVAVLRKVLKDRLIPEARLTLWAVCLFRLLTPAAPESVLSLWGLFRPRQAPAVSAPAPAPVAGTPQLYTPAQADPSPAAPAIPWETVLLAVWLIVGGLLAARYVLSWRHTRRAVACAIPVKQDDPRYASLPKCARLREGPMEGAPLTFGAVKPTVVLTPGLGGEALDCVLAHEGVHAKRRDNLWHYAMALALVVHWWNPAVWLMARLLRRDIELSCDRAAVKKLGAERRAEYANALVSMATQESGPAFCQTFGRKAAEERILSVMKFKKTSIIGVIFTLALVLAVTVAFASAPKEPEPAPDITTSVELGDITLPSDVAKYASQLYAGMTRDEVHQLLGEPSFSSSSLYSDTYELDPDSHERQLSIYYEMDGTIIQVRYFSDGTDPDVPGIDLTPFLTAAGEDWPTYVDPSSAINAPDKGKAVDDYDVKLPTFDEDGSPVSSDGGTVGKEFYAYEFVSGSDNAAYARPQSSQNATPESQALFLENGYTLDENGNALIYDDNGQLFMKLRKGISSCIRTDCSISDQHYHKNGEVIYLYSNDPGLLCTRENCHETEYHEHDGLTYKPILNICTRDGCGDTGVHEHDGVIYKGWTNKSTYIGPAASSHDNREGHHVEEPATHHSESHHSGGHH